MKAKHVTSDTAVVSAGRGRFWGAVLVGGSDAATLTVYDNTSGSGTVLLALKAVAGESAVCILPDGVWVDNGIYADLTGTSPAATIFYT